MLVLLRSLSFHLYRMYLQSVTRNIFNRFLRRMSIFVNIFMSAHWKNIFFCAFRAISSHFIYLLRCAVHACPLPAPTLVSEERIWCRVVVVGMWWWACASAQTHRFTSSYPPAQFIFYCDCQFIVTYPFHESN